MDKESLLNEISMISKSLPSHIQHFNSRFDFENLPYSEPKLSPNYRLMIDKRFMPNSSINHTNEYEIAWMNFAIGAGCYAYKTIGENFTREFKILLANSAISAVLSGFLAEHDRCQEVMNCKSNSLCDNDNPVQENIYQLDHNFECIHDGEWFYGLWTTQNSALACDMDSVIDQEILDFCAKLMITTMESYYYTNRFYTPDTIRIIHETMNHELIIKYGIDDENSLKQLMHIIGHWISRRHFFSVIRKHTGCTSKLIPVNVLGNRRLCLTRDIWIRFCEPPAGWKRIHLAYQIAEKLVRSIYLLLFADYDSLIKMKFLYDKICRDAYSYHVDRNYLTSSSTPTEIDDGCGLLGRLITFLKYEEPDSELFRNSFLKYNDKTCEAYYDDYDDQWESFMKSAHDKLDKNATKNAITKYFPKSSCGYDEKLIRCWDKFNVNHQTRFSLLEYFRFSSEICKRLKEVMDKVNC